MRPKLPKAWKRPSSHDTQIPMREQAWRERYCLRRGCYHPVRLTWLCIEFYLAAQASPTHLGVVRYDAPGPRFREFARLVEQPSLRPDAAAVLIDRAFRKLIFTKTRKAMRVNMDR